jgi:hypothetical protein
MISRKHLRHGCAAVRCTTKHNTQPLNSVAVMPYVASRGSCSCLNPASCPQRPPPLLTAPCAASCFSQSSTRCTTPPMPALPPPPLPPAPPRCTAAAAAPCCCCSCRWRWWRPWRVGLSGRRWAPPRGRRARVAASAAAWAPGLGASCCRLLPPLPLPPLLLLWLP